MVVVIVVVEGTVFLAARLNRRWAARPRRACAVMVIVDPGSVDVSVWNCVDTWVVVDVTTSVVVA